MNILKKFAMLSLLATLANSCAIMNGEGEPVLNNRGRTIGISNEEAKEKFTVDEKGYMQWSKTWEHD